MRPLLAGMVLALGLALPARAEPPLWVVRDADSEIVIFGSVHLLPPGLNWRPARLDAALARADDVWFELPYGPELTDLSARLARQAGVFPPNRSLFRMLKPADAQRLSEVATVYGVDLSVLDRLEPWLAEVSLAEAAYRRAGASSLAGVEATLASAVPVRAQRRAFETAEQQIAMLDTPPYRLQIASLMATVAELDEEPDSYAKLVRAWMSGDLKALERQAFDRQRAAAPTLLKRQVTDRNARWATTLGKRLKGRGRSVVIVGVGHLIGPGSLPQRLRALGYSVEGP